MSKPNELSRRGALMKLGILINGGIAALLAVPIVGYVLSPLRGKAGQGYNTWVPLGPLSQFPEGQTRLAKFRNPFVRPWDGQTADIPCWVRRLDSQTFQVFAINCAHLGCPVRWFAQSGLFLCPCHGGAYYADGSRASGPPERGLFKYAYKIEGDQLVIRAGELPTLAADARRTLEPATGGRKPCAG
jgi:menaquinol-cytochrome c reductase iron-sulfur subunit